MDDHKIPMHTYAKIQDIKDSIEHLFKHADELSNLNIDEDTMDRIVGFLFIVDSTLNDYPDPEDRCNRLRNLVVTLFAMIIDKDKQIEELKNV